MRIPPSVLLIACLSACRATPARVDSPAAPASGTRYAWSATIADAPPAAGSARVELAVPRRSSLSDVRVVALVGNAPYEVRLPAREPGRFATGPLVIEWTPHGTTGALVVEAHGRVPELGLRFLATEGEDVEALASELRAGTRVTIDGRSAVVEGRLERLR